TMVLTPCERNHHHSLSLAGASEVDSRPAQIVLYSGTGVVPGSDTPAVVVVAASARDRRRSTVGPVEAGVLASVLDWLGPGPKVTDAGADGNPIWAGKI